MAKGSSKQRAKKKQQKQQHRKAKLARRVAHANRPAAAERSLLDGWRPVEEGLTGLAARRRITHVEAARLVEAARAAHHPGTENVWTPSLLAACTEEQILKRLGELGIAMDRESYLAATARGPSAFAQVGEPWLKGLPAGTPARDRDFVVLASLDLWRRWRPERPSREMLVARHLDGWDAKEQGDERAALEALLDFGDMLFRALPDARTDEEIDRAMTAPPDGEEEFPFTGFLGFLGELGLNGAQGDGAALALRAADYLRAARERISFREEADAYLLDQIRAGILLNAGRQDEGVALLRRLIEERPEEPGAYVLLADLLGARRESTDAELEEAIALLDRAIEETADEHVACDHEHHAHDWGLEPRRERLVELLAARKALPLHAR
jgi:tetratricopeptide (TPR) repeat protein